MACNCMLCRYRKGLVKKSEYIEFFQKEKCEVDFDHRDNVDVYITNIVRV